MTSSEILSAIAEWLVERGAVPALYSSLYDGTPDDILDVDEVIFRWIDDPDVTPEEIEDVIEMIFPGRSREFDDQIYDALVAVLFTQPPVFPET